MADWLGQRVAGWLAGWLAGRLADWLAGVRAGWLVASQAADCRVGRLAERLDGGRGAAGRLTLEQFGEAHQRAQVHFRAIQKA